jgi:adenine-specific DNA-methyltransferase
MSQTATINAVENSGDVVSLKKQIADLLHQNQSLEQENEKLSKRFGLVWPEQPEFFVQVISDTEVVYQNGLYRRVGALETNGSKARLDFDGSDESEDLKRGDSPYLYTGKQSNKTYLGNGGIAYEWRKFINEDYLPTLVKKGPEFGFDDKNGQRKNLLIEGDNYHALQVLQHTHRGVIDVIYIDPPYNTGNGDFKYNDRFVSDEDGDKHSSWLSFMLKRMRLARELLSSKGVVFISIDNNEYERLKLLCDRVFGEENKVTEFHWKTRSTGGQVKDGAVIEQVEFCLCYAKSKKSVRLYGKLEDKNDVRDLRKSGGQWQREFRPKQHYPIYVNKKNFQELSLDNKEGYFPVFPLSGEGVEGFWAYGKDTCAHKISEKALFAKETPSGVKIYVERKSSKHSSLGNFIDIPSSRGSRDIKSLELFDFTSTPKPIELMKTLFYSVPKAKTFLDFFAGSGTTGHAIWEMNKETRGKRSFVLVTNNESNICEGVTYERLRRCNLPEHGNYQQGLEYLQLKHVAETEVDGYDMANSFEHIKQVVNVRFGSFSVIEETDDWYITDKIAVLKNYVKYPAFFEKHGKHPAYGLVTKKERQAQTFRDEASKRVSIDDIHVFNKEYLNDLYRVVREDMA